MKPELRERLINELSEVGINNPSDDLILLFSEFIAIDVEWDNVKADLKQQNEKLFNLFFK